MTTVQLSLLLANCCRKASRRHRKARADANGVCVIGSKYLALTRVMGQIKRPGGLRFLILKYSLAVLSSLNIKNVLEHLSVEDEDSGWPSPVTSLREKYIRINGEKKWWHYYDTNMSCSGPLVTRYQSHMSMRLTNGSEITANAPIQYACCRVYWVCLLGGETIMAHRVVVITGSWGYGQGQLKANCGRLWALGHKNVCWHELDEMDGPCHVVKTWQQ